MNTLNIDTMFSIINFLDNNSISNLKKTNNTNFNIIKYNKNIIIRNKLVNLWGYDIYNLIKDEINIEDYFKNNNLDVNLKILDIFYNKVLTKNLNISTNLFIEIYDISYKISNDNFYNHLRDVIFFHRIKCIQKYMKQPFSYNDNKIIRILNATRYFNRYCFFLGDNNYVYISNEDIIDMINGNYNWGN